MVEFEYTSGNAVLLINAVECEHAWGSEVLVSQLSCEFKEPVGDLTNLEAFQELRYDSPGQNQVVAV